MAWYTGALKRPVAGHTNGPMQAYVGVVLHVNDSNGNLYNWVSGENNMSCHFEVYKTGVAEQYLSTSLSSWAQEDGNDTYLSIETEGYPGEPLTAKQLEKTAQIVAWMASTHGIPLQLADVVGRRGLAWHGMGGAAWGGHPGCPGDLRKGQRAAILTRARQINCPDPLEEIMSFYPDKASYEAAMRALVHEEIGKYTALYDPATKTWDGGGHNVQTVVARMISRAGLDRVAASVDALKIKLGA